MPLDNQTDNEHQPGSYIKTAWTELAVKRKDVKDSGDGTIMMAFEIAASDVPSEYASSPDGSLWELALQGENEDKMTFKATRHGIKDQAKGRVDIRFDTMVAGLPMDRVYGCRNDVATLSMRLLAGRAPFPHLVDRSERAAVLRRAAMYCLEPAFGDWIAVVATQQGFPDIPVTNIAAALDMPEMDYQTARSAENMCRVARIHSRAEVLTSSAAAERVETLIREYRDSLWQKQRLAQDEQQKERGIKK